MEHQEWIIAQYLRKKKPKQTTKLPGLKEAANKHKSVIVIEMLLSTKTLSYKWCLI